MLFRCARITYGLLVCIVWTQGIYCENKYDSCKNKGCVTGNGNGNKKESNQITENTNLYDRKKVKEKPFKLDSKEKRGNNGEISNEKFNKYAIKRNEDFIADDNESEQHDKTRKIAEQIRNLQEQLEYLNGKNEKCSKVDSKGNCKNNVPSADLISTGKKSTNGKKSYKVELTPLYKTENGDNGNTNGSEKSEKIYKKYRRIRSERKTEKQNKREALFKNWKTFKRITEKPSKPDKTKWINSG